MSDDTPRLLISIGALAGFLAVLLGAFGAHALKAQLDDGMLRIYQTAVQYHAVHGLAILFCGLLAIQFQQKLVVIAGYLFALGILVFSGSLYLLAVTGMRWLGAITPLGGLSFLAGWAFLGWAMLAGRTGGD